MTRNTQKLLFLPFILFDLGFFMSLAYAIDIKNVESGDGAFDFFRSGIAAYKERKIDDAIYALRYASERGHAGATWKLAHIYASGDGVTENDLIAYQFFLKLVKDGATPGSQNESYVSDALLALGNYSRSGIVGTPIVADLVAARKFYIQAASDFGNSYAQFELGKMLLTGAGGKKNSIQAARWFRLSAQKGNAAAQAMLGNMLFQAGKTVRGLAMIIAACERAEQSDLHWIQTMQEKAFAISIESDRRTAISLAHDILSRKDF